MSVILITGGTGLVGKALQKSLTQQHEVRVLSRTPKEKNEYKWDVNNNTIDENALHQVDYIIHLAGAGIADERWTAARKKIIIDSRVATANLLFEKVKDLKIPLKGFISASGIGYYGAITSDKIFTEEDKPANDFLGQVCEVWEDAAHQFKKLDIAVTILRTGIVLSNKGGALDKMVTPVIAPLGTGKQYLPWIHIDDLCKMYVCAIDGKLDGIFNAIAPEHHTSKTFSKQLAKSVKKPFVSIPAPSFMMKLAFGEMSKILLEGSRVSAQKIIDKNFKFKFKKLDVALNNLFHPNN